MLNAQKMYMTARGAAKGVQWMDGCLFLKTYGMLTASSETLLFDGLTKTSFNVCVLAVRVPL